MWLVSRFLNTLKATFLQASQNQPIAPEVEHKTPEVEYGAPEAIDRLVEEYHTEKTKWVFASDMAELYEAIEKYNASAADNMKISVTLHVKVNTALNETIENSGHLQSDENIRQHIGPDYVGGIRLHQGAIVLDGDYYHNPLNTYLQLEDSLGERRKLFFGMDKPLDVAAQFEGINVSSVPYKMFESL